jgi:hypothetical protein
VNWPCQKIDSYAESGKRYWIQVASINSVSGWGDPAMKIAP